MLNQREGDQTYRNSEHDIQTMADQLETARRVQSGKSKSEDSAWTTLQGSKRAEAALHNAAAAVVRNLADRGSDREVLQLTPITTLKVKMTCIKIKLEATLNATQWCVWPLRACMHSQQRLGTLLMSRQMVFRGISSQTWIRASELPTHSGCMRPGTVLL
ncbi:hypothetical protein GJAV_G00021570 [Gymnothorax javanicus]|nr:hypothetical protein GJAV_G00021570 [Gymnothorax javanicus]